MSIDRQNIISHELIGLDVAIVEGTNRDIVGTRGKVVDESRNTLTMESHGREKIAAKHSNTFRFTLPDGTHVKVLGDLLIARPEDRAAKRPRWYNR
ncbi:MAG: ribonuclease P protein component 1 [Halobacteriota archaeon]